LALTLALGVTALSACASFTLSELKPGVSTEADVRALLGAPTQIWLADAPTAQSNQSAPNATQITPRNPAGAERVLEYSRQLTGFQNFMIPLGADGKVTAVNQVLTPQSFAKVQVGMPLQAVLPMLGTPKKITHYALKNETHYDWRYRDGPNLSDSKIFWAVFSSDMRVVTTGSIEDPDLNPDIDMAYPLMR
jgi:outer membrane protein assembly factor BamE (lipoprotein component of BamABCDE complex)